jgi:hypothetical protein
VNNEQWAYSYSMLGNLAVDQSFNSADAHQQRALFILGPKTLPNMEALNALPAVVRDPLLKRVSVTCVSFGGFFFLQALASLPALKMGMRGALLGGIRVQ